MTAYTTKPVIFQILAWRACSADIAEADTQIHAAAYPLPLALIGFPLKQETRIKLSLR